MLNSLSKAVHVFITEQGYKASNIPATYNYDPVALKSDWSHRSAAFIAGMGTFGINNMLITEKGCCGRLGSVITTLPLEADTRPDGEFCLYKSRGICGACIRRCPNKAFTFDPARAIKAAGSQLELGGAAEYGMFYDRFLCNEQIYLPASGRQCICVLPRTRNPSAAPQKFLRPRSAERRRRYRAMFFASALPSGNWLLWHLNIASSWRCSSPGVFT